MSRGTDENVERTSVCPIVEQTEVRSTSSEETSARIAKLSPAKLALVVLELQSKLDAIERSKTEPIAIIGVGCSFPGNADSPDKFWRLVREGKDAIREIPADRWDLEAFYDPDPTAPGKMCTRFGGFLDRIDRFDAQAFGISPTEAERMDPQQRLLLETAWEAIEDAGLDAEELQGTRTGVFIGISTHDYSRFQMSSPVLIDAFACTSHAGSIAANRLSYFFDLRGPSLAVDTACSSSLVAVHLACQSLRNGESTMALAGGVNVILGPELAISFTKAGLISAKGCCKPFDESADGFVRSEGVGVTLLKPLSRALADGDPIYAVIRGSAVNQDGQSNGLTAPSRRAQENVLRAAYRNAGVKPAQIQYVETHGSGTVLGDLIEADALGTVLACERPPGLPCAIGSVKGNIGHTEAASGIASLIKVALALKYREIPPSLNFEQPNQHIPFDRLGLRVQRQLEPWPASSTPKLAALSAFGFGGTNAHLVIEDAPAVEPSEGSPAWQLLALSANTEAALDAMQRNLVEYLKTNPEVSLADVAYTLQVGRKPLACRRAFVCEDLEDAIRILGASREAGIASPAVDRRTDRALLLEELSKLWVGGAKVDWKLHRSNERRNRLRLPTYPFESRRYWLDSSVTRIGSLNECGFESPRNAEGATTKSARARPNLSVPYTAPLSDVERTVAQIWEIVLGVRPVGVHDNFFELGGHSLQATQIATRLHETFEVELPLRDLFESRTVASQARLVLSLYWVDREIHQSIGSELMIIEGEV